MNIYEFTDVRTKGSGNMTNDARKTYRNYEQMLQKYFVTHGNNLAHTYGGLVDQVSPTRDATANRINGRHVNVTFIRAMCFCHYLLHKYSNMYDTFLKTGKDYLPPGFKLQELYQGAIYLLNRDIVRQLEIDGKAEFMRLAKDSKTHKENYDNPNEYLGEYYIHDRNDVPLWDYLIIGATGAPIVSSQRVNLYDDVFPKLKAINPNGKILLFPNVPLTKGKDEGTTGNLCASKVGSDIIKRLFLVKNGKIVPTSII